MMNFSATQKRLGITHCIGILSILGFGLTIQGCMIAPGLQVNAGPSVLNEPTEPRDEGDHTLIPITHSLVEQMVKEHPAGKRKVPPEWIKNDSSYTYKIGVGDILQVVVWDNQDLGGGTSMMPGAASPQALGAAAAAAPAVGSGDSLMQNARMRASTGISTGSGFVVGPDGHIHFPYLGRVSVVGRTAGEVRDELTHGLSRYIREPQVEVTIGNYRSQKVHVSGEVTTPGQVAITDLPLHLADAVNAVGPKSQSQGSGGQSSGTSGASPMGADLDDVQVTRNGKSIQLSLYDIFKFGRLDENIQLQDGDLVNVPSCDNKKIYVVGEVKNQGLRPLIQGRLTLEEAIQGSGGISQDSASDNKIMVFRASQDKNKPNVYHMYANSPDSFILASRFPLLPGDVLYVGPANVTRMQRILSSFIPVTGFAGSIGAMTGGF